MTTDHYDPHGQALLDYFHGDTSATIRIHEYGKQKEVPLSLFFRGWDEFPSLERKAIEMCRGRVLDIGAGTGCHSLVLQERGLFVYAIDFLADCVEIMKKRGVKEAHCGNIHTFDAEPFDTLLCLMNGIAVVENEESAKLALEHRPGLRFIGLEAESVPRAVLTRRPNAR